jgi:hypothetical protein
MNDKAVGGLKVIGIGLPRTGTSSIQAALAILDVGPVHHMTVRASSNLGRAISACAYASPCILGLRAS